MYVALHDQTYFNGFFLANFVALIRCGFVVNRVVSDNTVKNIRISTDILWRVFHILTELFASINRRNNEVQLSEAIIIIIIDIFKVA